MTPYRITPMVVAALVLILVVFLALGQCQKRRALATQERIEDAQAGAATNSASDAIGTVARSGGDAAASEELTRKNEEEIRNAQGANDAVNPAVRDAGLASLCRRAAYRDHPKCKLRRAPSG